MFNQRRYLHQYDLEDLERTALAWVPTAKRRVSFTHHLGGGLGPKSC